MFAHLTRPGTPPRTAALRAGTRLRRCAAALAALTVGLLASAAAIPAAFARDVPGGYYGTTSVAPVPAAPFHAATTTGGMAGWQITLIALGTALIAAAVTIVLARARAAHRAAPSPAA